MRSQRKMCLKQSYQCLFLSVSFWHSFSFYSLFYKRNSDKSGTYSYSEVSFRSLTFLYLVREKNKKTLLIFSVCRGQIASLSFSYRLKRMLVLRPFYRQSRMAHVMAKSIRFFIFQYTGSPCHYL